MRVKPLLIDLYCGAGAAGDGYRMAGFRVVGVDISLGALRANRGPTVLADALTYPLRGAQAVHASPPCQAYSTSAAWHRRHGATYPKLIEETRYYLAESGLPWVIENVPGSPLRADFTLCGCQFGLEVRRERWFETSWAAPQPPMAHDHSKPAIPVVGHGVPRKSREQLGYSPTVDDMRRAMGIHWAMPRAYLTQAIPPAYTHYVGGQLRGVV